MKTGAPRDGNAPSDQTRRDNCGEKGPNQKRHKHKGDGMLDETPCNLKSAPKGAPNHAANGEQHPEGSKVIHDVSHGKTQ